MGMIFLRGFFEQISNNGVSDLSNFDISEVDNLSSSDIMIIPLELSKDLVNSHLHRLTEFYGIDLVKRIIRTELKLKNPVLFTSFMPFDYFVYKDKKKKLINPTFEIMLTHGHDFLRLPFDIKTLEKKCMDMRPLTDLQLKDVIYNFCNIYGQIDEITHRYIGEARILSGIKGDNDRLISLKDDCISELNLLTSSNNLLDKNKYQITKDKYVPVFRNAGEDAKSLIPIQSDNNEHSIGSRRKKTWKVLILDDKPDELSDLIRLLNARGIETIIQKNATDAIEEINKDYANYISVVISDYRLMEKRNGYIRQQEMQGYDFINEVAGMERSNKLIALSGLSRSFLLESFRTFNINVLVYSKNDILTGNAINTFVDTIESEGDIAYSYVIDRPSSSSWSKFAKHYKDFRNSSEKESINLQIAEKANFFINKVESILLSKNEIFRDNLGLPDLKPATTIKTYKSEDFINKMAARRIAIYFILKYGFEPQKIYAMMVYNTLCLNKITSEKQRKHLENGLDFKDASKNSEKELANSAKQLINTHLAIKEILPFGILFEEAVWLKNGKGINIKDVKSVYMSYVYAIKVIMQEYFDSNPEVVRILTENHNETFISLGDQNVPVIKTLSDVQRFINKIDSMLEEIDQNKYFKMLEDILLIDRNDEDVRNYYEEEFDSFINTIRLKFKGMIKYE